MSSSASRPGCSDCAERTSPHSGARARSSTSSPACVATARRVTTSTRLSASRSSPSTPCNTPSNWCVARCAAETVSSIAGAGGQARQHHHPRRAIALRKRRLQLRQGLRSSTAPAESPPAHPPATPNQLRRRRPAWPAAAPSPPGKAHRAAPTRRGSGWQPQAGCAAPAPHQQVRRQRPPAAQTRWPCASLPDNRTRNALAPRTYSCTPFHIKGSAMPASGACTARSACSAKHRAMPGAAQTGSPPARRLRQLHLRKQLLATPIRRAQAAECIAVEQPRLRRALVQAIKLNCHRPSRRPIPQLCCRNALRRAQYPAGMPRPAALAVLRRTRMHRKRSPLALLQRPNQNLQLDRSTLRQHQRSLKRQLIDLVQANPLCRRQRKLHKRSARQQHRSKHHVPAKPTMRGQRQATGKDIAVPFRHRDARAQQRMLRRRKPRRGHVPSDLPRQSSSQ